MKKILTLAILTSLISSPLVFADTTVKAPEGGTLHITVLDQNGKAVQDAPVYIYGVNRTHFVGGADIPGTTTFSMKEGEYRISSALIKKGADEYIERFASNEAHVKVVSGDNVSLVLTLKPVENADQQVDSYATLHVAGIPSGLINN